MKKYDRLLMMYFFDRLQKEELELIKEYFYDKSEKRYNELSKDYLTEDKLEKLINKGIVKPYLEKRYRNNKRKYLYLLDREVKNKLNKR